MALSWLFFNQYAKFFSIHSIQRCWFGFYYFCFRFIIPYALHGLRECSTRYVRTEREKEIINKKCQNRIFIQII